MIQLNLLPDVKKEFLSAQRMKRNIISLAFLVSMVSIGVVVLLALYVHGAQVLARNQLQNDINKDSQQLKSQSNLSKILTVQDALAALPTLHQQKPLDSRLFNYLKILVPDQVSLTKLDLENEGGTLSISGHSANYKALNVFADMLKNAQLTTTGQSNAAFNNVTISTASSSSDPQHPGIDFTLTMVYNPDMFSAKSQHPNINVPSVTTGGGLAKSQPVFNGSTTVPSTSTTTPTGQGSGQ